MQSGVMALFAGMMISCTEDLGEKVKTNPITFTIDSDGLDEVSGTTRGTQVTSIINFGVSASIYDKDAAGGYTSAGCGSYFYNQSATNGTPMNYFWPTTDYKVSFFAYYPYNGINTIDLPQLSASNTIGLPIYTYTVPQTVTTQSDFMTAQVTDCLCGPQGTVNLSFGHRCSDIKFLVDNQKSDALTVNSISIYGVKYSGTWTSGTSWSLSGSTNSPLSHPFTLTANINVSSATTADITSTANHFIMLPQTVSAGTDLFVIKTTENGDERTYTYTVPFGGITWEMGKSYTYTIVLNDNDSGLSVSPVSVEDWNTINSLTESFSVRDWVTP